MRRGGNLAIKPRDNSIERIGFLTESQTGIERHLMELNSKLRHFFSEYIFFSSNLKQGRDSIGNFIERVTINNIYYFLNCGTFMYV